MRHSIILNAIVLCIILVGGTTTFWYAKGNTVLQMTAGVMTTVAYVLWGITHHALAGNLHRKIVLEYVLVGMIAIVILATLAI